MAAEQLQQLLNFLQHARKDESRGDPLFRYGFNAALDVVADRIREMQAPKDGVNPSDGTQA